MILLLKFIIFANDDLNPGLAPGPAGVPDPVYPVYTGEKSTKNSRFHTGEFPVKNRFFDFIPVNFRPGKTGYHRNL